jgi:hypothetical protein
LSEGGERAEMLWSKKKLNIVGFKIEVGPPLSGESLCNAQRLNRLAKPAMHRAWDPNRGKRKATMNKESKTSYSTPYCLVSSRARKM